MHNGCGTGISANGPMRQPPKLFKGLKILICFSRKMKFSFVAVVALFALNVSSLAVKKDTVDAAVLEEEDPGYDGDVEDNDEWRRRQLNRI